MAMRAPFTRFDPYRLTGVKVTDRKVGHGSYATVLELEYMGLKCAGKKIHEQLLQQGDASYTVRRFEEECHLLSQVRHPNIVQFLGIFFQQGVLTPILVMEFLPTTLTSCIEQYGILPKEISYSILHDVALGLHYLHGQTPPIIHRDLSSNNVLLTPNMTAKISDLGVARIFHLTLSQVSRMTQTPGTPTFMPPEVMAANPKYDTSVDVFSYGVMMIHTLSGQWPEPQIGPSRTKKGRIIPVSEVERREMFLKVIEKDSLTDLIPRCINNDPQHRPHTKEVARRIGEIASQFPATFANKLEMLRQLKAVEEKNKDLEEERKFQTTRSKYQRQLEAIKEENKTLAEEGERIQANRLEILGQLEAAKEEKRALAEEGKKVHTALMEKINTTMVERDATISAMSEQLTKARQLLTTEKLALQAGITWKQCAELPTGLSAGVNAIINGKIYCGGRVSVRVDDNYIVYCYDPSQDKWTTLPPLPVKWFGLGQINGKLVAVGGVKEGKAPSNEIYTCSDEKSQKWKPKFPPMPTARYGPGVLSLQSALIVAGGFTSSYTAAVEIFKSDTSQWYKTNPLPTVCCNISLVAIQMGKTCCVLGGYQHPSHLNQALYASIDDLLGNAIPASQTTRSGTCSINTRSAWKTLPNTPTYAPAAAVLAGKLLAIGGKDTAEGGGAKKEVFMYSPSASSWIYISDLPAPRFGTTVAFLSSIEILVIGGWAADRVNTVYKGMLTIL